MNNLTTLNNTSVRLTEKQNILYNYIKKKVELDKPITFEEAKKLYIDNSCRNFIGNEPAMYCGTKLFVMDENELKISIVNYITRGIGVLVIKGALKITPQLQFN